MNESLYFVDITTGDKEMGKSAKGLMHLTLTIVVALLVYYVWQSGSA